MTARKTEDANRPGEAGAQGDRPVPGRAGFGDPSSASGASRDAAAEPPVDGSGSVGDGEAWHEAFAQIGALGFSGIVSVMGLGLWLAWVWFALNCSIPLYGGGTYAVLPPALALLAFAAAMGALAFPQVARWALRTRAVVPAAAVAASLGCAAMALEAFGVLPDGSEYAAVVLCGAGAAVELFAFGLSYARLAPGPALVAYAGAALVCFVTYFCLTGIGETGGYVLFALLPLGIAGVLRADRDRLSRACLDEIDALGARGAGRRGRGCAGGEPGTGAAAPTGGAAADGTPVRRPRFSQGYKRLCLASGVYFAAISFTHAMAPIEEHGFASDAGVVCMTLVELAVVLVYVTRRGTFKILKVCYLGSVLLMIFASTVAPFTGDTALVYEALRNASYFVLFMVVWVLLSWVASYGETPARQVFGVAFCVAGAAMAAGWAVGIALHLRFGDTRDAFTMAVGFVVLAFFSFGFNMRDFPRLVMHGARDADRAGAGTGGPAGMAGAAGGGAEAGADGLGAAGAGGDARLRARMDLLAREGDLSPREVDVFAYLAQGYGGERIADQLGISYHTVRAHVRSIYKKLDVHAREELLDLVRGDGTRDGAGAR